MATITAEMVRDLREKSGAGMMDCKKALTETWGDFEEAQQWLRKKGLAAAAKKSSRAAADGLVAVAVDGPRGVVLEVNAETDFVARNESFQAFVKTLAQLALKNAITDIDTLKTQPYPSTGRTVDEELTHLIATIGEQMTLRRLTTLSVPSGSVVSYVHNELAPGLGKIGVLVALSSGAKGDALKDLGRKLAMHVAAAFPQSLAVSDLDPIAIQKERDVFSDQARASGKPESIIEKMIEGRLKKFYQEVVLLEQTFVMDNETRIADVVEAVAKTEGSPITLTAYARYQLGEGIEIEKKDFAEEVRQAVG
ncbi:MAG: translation elongation factor Ts [Alphaproteobacteria bacterium]